MSLVIEVVTHLDRVEESVGTISAGINQKASGCDCKSTVAETEKQPAKSDLKPTGAPSWANIASDLSASPQPLNNKNASVASSSLARKTITGSRSNTVMKTVPRRLVPHQSTGQEHYCRRTGRHSK